MDKMQLAIVSLWLFPLGVFVMCGAVLWHLKVVIDEVVYFNRYQDKQLVWVLLAMFFSFGFALYILAPKARKKGLGVVSLLIIGFVCYSLANQWLPKAPKNPTPPPADSHQQVEK